MAQDAEIFLVQLPFGEFFVGLEVGPFVGVLDALFGFTPCFGR